jgi:hypothetical protein
LIELPFLSRIAPALDKLGLLFVSSVVIRSREGVVFGEMPPHRAKVEELLKSTMLLVSSESSP